MTNEEKAKLLTPCVYCSRICKAQGVDGVEPCNTYYSLIEMAEWKDKQNKWHKIEDDDLPKEDGDYLLVMKMKYGRREGTSRPCMNLSQFSIKDGWKDPYGDEFAKETIFVAWMELPKYEEE